MNLLHPVWVEVNLDNLKYNIDKIKSKIGASEIIGIVKANAYGHGAVEISKALIEYGVQKLGVANILEAIELRENGVTAPIMILGVTESFAIDAVIEHDVETTVSTYEFAKALNEKALALNKVCKIHLALDTGMGRIGFRNNNKSIEEIISISKMSNLDIESIFSHFSTADSKNKEYSNHQMDVYKFFIEELNKHNITFNKMHLSNSAAIMDIAQSHLDSVRPGIIQYGYYPSEEVIKYDFELKPILTWKTKILHIKEVEENSYIGYGNNFVTTRKSIIATLPVGYADGYSRGLSNKGHVIINGEMAPIVGNVCMDQVMVDVTDLSNVSLGDEVIVLGSDGDCIFNADNMASILGTINYELLCLIGRRIPRVYTKNNEIYSIKYFM